MANNRLGDEKFTLSGTDYWFMFPDGAGAQAFQSTSPFAPKSQTGERSYADYDAYAMLAQADFAGGMGQERLTDTTKYYDGQHVDTRSGHIILGPYVTTTDDAGSYVNETVAVDATLGTYRIRTTDYEVAARVTGLDMTITHIWLPLWATENGKRVTINLYQEEAVSLPFSKPGTILATATIEPSALFSTPQWVGGELNTSVTLSSDTVYWVGASQESDTGLLWYMWGEATLTDYAVGRFFGSDWVQLAYAPLVWLGNILTGARPLTLLTGTGADGIARLWGYGGHHLYYVTSASAVTYVLNNGGATIYDLTDDAVCAVWYQSDADTHASLYLGLGDDTDIVSFNGHIGAEAWTAPEYDGAGFTARAMCVHDNLLWIANDRNQVQAWDGTNLGSGGRIGDSTYPVRNLVSWNGYVWAGKDDGLYRVVIPDGYPTTGEPETQKVIDFTPLAQVENFSAMCVHQGDLYFNMAQGILRYTAAGVLTPVTPEIGLDLAVTERSRCTALCSSFNTLWAAFEAPFTSYSTIAASVDSKWHPIIQQPRKGEMIRSLAIDPAWYGDTPRLWFSSGLTLAYAEMPMTTQKRWLWTGLTYRGGGTLYSSWIDGNLRSIDKDWISVTLDVRLPTATEPDEDASVTVAFRMDEADAFTNLSQITTSGIQTVDFPDYTYGQKIQLSITLDAGVALAASEATGTPRVIAVILRYMERPADVQQFTRTYEISTHQTWRNGQPIQQSLATRRAWLRTLRESREPLTWTAWDGTSVACHVIDYAATEVPEVRDYADSGTITVTMRLQAV